MKRTIKLLLLFIIISISVPALLLANENNEAKKSKTKKNEQTIVLQVNMDCHSCVQKIEGNIPYEKGVKDLKVSLEKLECELTFRDDKTSVDKLIDAFKTLGYKAEVKKEASPNQAVKTDEHHGHIH